MKIAVMGTGGVGGYFGGTLARAGHEVVFIARGDHLAAIRKNGLTVESVQGDFSIPDVGATDDPATIGVVDLVLMCVKTWQLPEAVRLSRPMIGPQTIVLPLLNGVEAHEQITSALPHGIVLGGLARIVSYIAAPGVIHHDAITPYIGLGSMDGSHGERVAEIRETLASAGIKAEIPEDVTSALWAKFLFVCAWGAVGAVTRAPIGPIRSDPETRSLIRRAMAEIRAVGVARGVALGEDLIDRYMDFIDAMAPRSTTSLQRDIIEGRPSELDAWSGAVVRMARKAGVETPVHEIIYAALKIQAK